MDTLFETSSIATIKMKNRFVRSATWEGVADANGHVTDQLINTMVRLAKGGIACIITGHAFVHKTGLAGNGQLAIDSDTCISGLKNLVDIIHQHDVAIVAQLAHSGAFIHPIINKCKALGPSEISNIKNRGISKKMSLEDILMIVNAFGDAAVRAKTAGFDGVQLHAAHGYLLSEFLSPHFNKRNDEYGGNIENRSRIVVDIIRNIRQKTGKEFPILIKINSEDCLEGGFSIEDMVSIGKILKNEQIDAVELSGGTAINPKTTSSVRQINPQTESEEAYYRKAAKQFKSTINIPLILVGGIRSYTAANNLIMNHVTDYISFSRPLIREPQLIKKWEEGNFDRASCISCNACFRPGIQCVPERKLKENR